MVGFAGGRTIRCRALQLYDVRVTIQNDVELPVCYSNNRFSCYTRFAPRIILLTLVDESTIHSKQFFARKETMSVKRKFVRVP